MKKLVIILFACLLTESIWANHWTPQSSAYSEVMALTSVIQIDGVEQFSDQLEVGVFCEDECRGSQMAIEFAITHRFLVQLTIYGENGHELTFKLFDHSIGEELDLASPDAIIFNSNGIGQSISPINPYILNFTSYTIQNILPGIWSNPNIWEGNNVPGTYASVLIADDCVIDMNVLLTSLTIIDGKVLRILAGNTVTVIGDLISNSVDGLVIEDGAQLLNESANVKASYEKDIDAYTCKDSDGWYLISSPVDEMPISGSSFITEVFDLYRYKESTSVWENYRSGHADFTYFEDGRGYLFANSNTFSPAFKGNLNNEDIEFPVTCEAPNALAGCNIIGNPFPHVIYKGTGGAIDDANLTAGYYFLSFKGEWLARTFETAIQPGQGVLVRAIANADITIEKTNAEAIAESSSKDDLKRLKINVIGNGKEDCAFAYLCDGRGLNKVNHKNETVPLLYIPHDGSDYAIAMLGDDTQSFNVDFEAKMTGMYTLSVETLGEFDYIHIIDRLTGADVDMLVEDNYSFIASPTDSESRFIFILRDYSDVEENTEMSDFAYIANSELIVTGEGTLQLVDMMGRVVKTQEISGVETICQPTAGIYIVRILSGKDVKTQKIVVR